MSSPVVYSGLALGCSLAFQDTASISLFDIQNAVPLGTTVYSSGDDTYWQLKVSSTGPDGTHLAVSGRTGLRWVKQTAGSGTVTSVSGTVGVTVATGTTTPIVSLDGGTYVDSGASALTDWDVATGLTGNLDWEIDGQITLVDPGASSVGFSFQPNATATNQAAQSVFGIDSSTGAVTSTVLRIAGFAGSGQTGNLYFKLSMQSIKSDGSVKIYNCVAYRKDTSHKVCEVNGGVWTSAVAITSLRIHSDTASMIGAHSLARYKPISAV